MKMEDTAFINILQEAESYKEWDYIYEVYLNNKTEYYLKITLQPITNYIHLENNSLAPLNLKYLKIQYDTSIEYIIGDTLTINPQWISKKPNLHLLQQDLDKFKKNSSLHMYSIDCEITDNIKTLIFKFLKLSLQFESVKNDDVIDKFKHIANYYLQKNTLLLQTDDTLLNISLEFIKTHLNKENNYYYYYFNVLVNLLLVNKYDGEYLSLNIKNIIKQGNINFTRNKRNNTLYGTGSEIYTISTENKEMPSIYLLPSGSITNFMYSHKPYINSNSLCTNYTEYVTACYISLIQYKNINAINFYLHKPISTISINSKNEYVCCNTLNDKKVTQITEPEIYNVLKIPTLTIQEIEISTNNENLFLNGDTKRKDLGKIYNILGAICIKYLI